jgi:chromosomal replication initiation ATPase DnaA
VQQLTLGVHSSALFKTEDFLLTPAHYPAYHHLLQWPHWSQTEQAQRFDRFFWISGAQGSGKTHLCHILYHHAQQTAPNPVPVCLLTPEALESNFHEALPGYLYIVDGVSPARISDQALLHAINWVLETSAWMVFTSALSPMHYPTHLADLSSRLKALPSAMIPEPDDSFLEQLLVKLLADRQLRYQPETIPFIVKRMERSCEAAVALVDRLDNEALTAHRNLTLPFVKTVLASALHAE